MILIFPIFWEIFPEKGAMSAVIPAKLIHPISPDENSKGGAVNLWVKNVTIPRNPKNRLKPTANKDNIVGLNMSRIEFTYKSKSL